MRTNADVDNAMRNRIPPIEFDLGAAAADVGDKIKRGGEAPLHSIFAIVSATGQTVLGLMPTLPSIIQLGGVVHFRALGAAHIKAARLVDFSVCYLLNGKSKLSSSTAITGVGYNLPYWRRKGRKARG